MYPVGLCLHILPDVLWYDVACSWSGLRSVLGSVRFLFERYLAGWISQQKVVESAGALNFMGIPIMRMITATTAFKMPLYGISFSLSACPVSSTVFRNTEKLSCANEVSKQAFIYKGLLLSDRNFSGHKFHKISSIQDAMSLCLENQYYFNFYAANFNNGISRLFCCIKGNWHGADCTKHITERYTK